MVVRIKKGAKIYTAFKIYPLDEESTNCGG